MTRETLPSRRLALNFAFDHDGIPYIGCLGFSADRRPLEVFLSCKKTAGIEAIGRDAAVIVSLALQYGCPFDVMRQAITRESSGAVCSLIGRLLDEIEKIEPADPLGTGARPAGAADWWGRA